MESLERRLLFTWTGATSGSTNDAAHQYNNVANWAGGVIDDSFSGVTFTANTTIYFTANRTTGASGLNLGYSGNFNLTFMSSTVTTRTLTLAGNISSGVANQSVTLGDVTNTDDLSLALGAATRTFNTANNETLSVVNVVSGTGAITAAGSGTLLLSGANTYSGGTTLSSGQLDLNSAKSVGTGQLTINGGTLDNTSGGTITLSNNNTQTWGGNFTFLGTNNLTLGTGAVTLGANCTMTISSGIWSDSGIISGAFSLTKTGSGTLTLSGANTFSAGMTLSAGQLNINNAKSIGSGTFTINGGTIDNTSGGAITLSNNNAQTWGGNFTYVGTNSLNLGTGAVTLSTNVTLTGSASTLTVAGIIGDSGSGFSLAKSGAGTLALTAANTYSGGTTLNAGVLSFANTALGAGNITFGGSGTLQWNGANTQDVSSTIQAIGSGITATFDTNGNNVTLAAVLGGNGAIAKIGAGALTLTGGNTFAGGATQSAGQLNINNATAIGSGTLTIGGGTIDNTSGGAITLSNNNAVTISGSFTFTGSNALNLGTGGVLLAGNKTIAANASTLTLGGVVSDGGNGFSLSKAGGGTLTLNGANTLSGGVTTSNGTLNLGNAGAIGSGTFTINGGAIDNTSGSAMTLTGNDTQVWGGSFTFAGTNSLNLGTGAVSMTANRTVTVSSATLTVGGAISGAFSLTKSGNGTIQLSGNNTYSGGTTLSAGQININSSTSLGTGTFTINGGKIDNTSGGAITLTNNNAQIWGGNFTFTGTNNLDLGSGAVTLTGTRTITNNGGNLTIDGIISGAFGVTKAGNATLTLTGSNTYSGTTTLSAGLLNINNSAAIGTGTFTINGGTLDNTSGAAITLSNNNVQTWTTSFSFAGSNDLNLGTGAVTLTGNPTVTTTAGNLTVGGVISGAHNIVKAGSGTLTLNGANTYSTGTTLSAGQLNINNSTALGTGSFVINGGTIDNTSGAAITNTSNNAQTWSGDFTFAGSSDLNLGTGAVTLSANRIVTVSGGTFTVGGVISGAHSLTKSGSGALALAGANTFSTGMTLSAGQLNINNAKAVGSGTFTINGGALDNTSGGAITLSNNNAQTWGGDFTFAGSNNLNLGTGAVALGANRTVTVSAATLTEGGVISGAFSLTKLGAGTLTLTAADTYSGGTSINAGALSFSNNSLGTGNITFGGNSTLQWNGANTQDISSKVQAIGSGITATFDTNGNNVTLASVLSGNGGIAKIGAGKLTLSAANTFAGGTTLSAGQLNINNAAAVGSGVFTINGGTIDDTSGGAIVLSNNNAVALNGGFTFAGTANLNFGTGAVTLGGSPTLTISASTLTIGGAIGDSGNAYAITTAGSGTLKLTGNNIFSGGVTIGAGTLLADNASGSATGSGAVTVNSGATLSGTGTASGSVTVNSGAHLAPGDGGTSVFNTGSLILGSGSDLDIVLNGNTAGSGYDQINVNGSVTVSGSNLNLSGSRSTHDGTVLTIIRNNLGGTVSGNFAGLAEGATEAFNSVTYTSSYQGGAGNDVVLTANPAVTTATVASGSNPSVFGQSITFTATVASTSSGTPTGTVTFMDGATSLGTAALNGSGQAVLSTSGLSVGSHSVTVVYGGDTNFATSTSPTLTQTVNQDTSTSVVAPSANPSVSGQSVMFTATVTANSPGSGMPTGTVTFKDGSTVLGAGLLNGSGQATFNTSALSVGSHSITAVYGGDGNFTTSTSSAFTQTVNQDASTSVVISSANPSIFGQSVTLTATITANSPGSGTPTGMVTFEDGSTVFGTGTLNGSGQAAFNASGLSVGSHSITVIYGGDTHFTTSTSSALTQTVNQSTTNAVVTLSSNPAVFGQSITLTATVSANAPGTGTPTGTVTFKDGSTVVGTGTLNGAGIATFSTSGLSVGNHSITVVYGGDTNFTTSTSAIVTETENRDATSSAVSASVNPSVFGQAVTFTAVVTAGSPGSGTPTGTVTFKDGSTVLGTGTLNGSGVATFSTSGLSVGNHSITMVYGGDSDFTTGTSSALAQTVNQDASTSVVAPSANPSVSGQSVTFTATVTANSPGSGTPTGTVTFMDGATSLGTSSLNGSGVATLGISSLSVGSHSITVVYGGDTNFTSSTSSTLTQTVNHDSTSSAVSSSINPSASGQSVTFTATVTANSPGSGIPSGTVTFMDGATSLGTSSLNGSGIAALSTSSLSFGSHSITIIYGGDADFTGSVSSALTQSVGQDTTSAAVNSSTNASSFGQSVTFTATVTAGSPGSGTPTGTMTFIDGLTALGMQTLNGSAQATLTTSALAVGSHTITVVYGGDTDFSGATSSALIQVVNQATTSTALSPSTNSAAFGQSITLTATVTANAPGSGTPSGSVTFMDGATSLGTGALNGSGIATLTTSLQLGSNSITAVYGGSTDDTGSTSAASNITVNPDATSSVVSSSASPSVFGESVTFTAVVTANSPGSGTPTGTVTFMDGATSLGTGALNGSGHATLSVSSLSVGSHSITVVYGGDTDFTGGTSSVITQTVNQDSTTSAVSSSANPSVLNQSVTFTATVTANSPGSGMPTGTVTFMDGVTSLGTSTLNGSGIATLSTSSFGLGAHSITVVYGGDAGFTGSTSSALTQTVNQDATATTLGSSMNPSSFGQSVTLTATVTVNSPGAGTPTGTVTFSDGIITLGTQSLNGSGQASLSTSALSVGSDIITAVYNGDANDVSSTSSGLSQIVNTAVPIKLVFNQQPTDTAAGGPISPPLTVEIEDQFGDLLTDNTSDVTLSLASGTGTLLGTLTVQASGGVATFSNLAINTAGAYSIAANDGSLIGVTSNRFNIAPAAASRVVFLQQPAGAVTNQTLSPAITVAVEDSFGNLITSDASNITLALAGGAGNLNGTLIVAAVSGIASFSTLSLDTAGNHTLSASDGSLTGATSDSFTIASQPAQLTIGSQPTNVTAGAAAPPIVVDIDLPGGGIDTGFNSPVTLSMASGPTGGQLAGTLTVSAQNGIATFSDVQITVAGSYVLAASAAGGILVQTAPIAIAPGPVQQVAATQQPNPSWQFGPISPAIVIAQRDQFGNLVTTGGTAFTASIVSGPAGAILSGTTTVSAINGFATFSNISVNLPGDYTLAFTNGAESPVIINSLQIVSIPARPFSFNGMRLSNRAILFQQQENAPLIVASGPPAIAPSVSNVLPGVSSLPSAIDIAAVQPLGSDIDLQALFSSISVTAPDFLKRILEST